MRAGLAGRCRSNCWPRSQLCFGQLCCACFDRNCCWTLQEEKGCGRRVQVSRAVRVACLPHTDAVHVLCMRACMAAAFMLHVAALLYATAARSLVQGVWLAECTPESWSPCCVCVFLSLSPPSCGLSVGPSLRSLQSEDGFAVACVMGVCSTRCAS